MASSLFESFSGGIELNDVICCVWCNRQQLTQLVQLGCFHLSCKVCLQRKIEDQRPGAVFNCPKCDMSCLVPTGGVDSFPDEPLQHRMNQIAEIFSNNKPICKPCEQVNAVSSASSVCITCKINLCDRDAKRHQGTPGHKVIKHEELCVEPNLSLMLKSKADICPDHSIEKKYFCQKCKILICSECAMLSHSDHKKDAVKNLAADYKNILQDKMEKVQKTKRTATDSIKQLQKKLEKMQEHCRKEGEKLQKEKSTTGDFQKIVKELKFNTLQVNFEITEEENKIKQCNSAECYIKVFIKYSSDSDIIVTIEEFLSKFNLQNCIIIEEYKGAGYLSDKLQGVGLNENVSETKKVERKHLNGWELETKWKEEMGWPGVAVCGEKCLVVCGQTMRWLTMDGRCIRENMCTQLGFASDVDLCEGEAYVVDSSKREVFVVDMDVKLKRRLCLPVKEHLLEREKENNLRITLDHTNKDIYVSSMGTEIIYKCERGSKEFKPWITKGLDQPHYICVAPDHHLVVSNWGSRTVVKFDTQGKVMWRYSSSMSNEPQLSPLQGVCADRWGHVFLADFGNNRIAVLSKDGKCEMNLDIGEKIDRPYAVCFENGRLVVTASESQYMYVIKLKYC